MREHAILHKKVINLDHDGDRKVKCAWDECDRDGYEMHKVRVNYGTPEMPHILNYVFCTERHKQYFLNSHRKYGRLPEGYRLSTI